MLAPYQIGGPRYSAVSDFDGPYAEMPPEVAAPRYGPMLLPAPEVYTVVRENGFSPLGIPRQRGFFYTISVINRGGDDGRLVIDARNGRIVRFVPAYRMGGNINRDLSTTYGPAGPLPPVSPVRGVAAAAGADPAGWRAARPRCRCPARCRREPASRTSLAAKPTRRRRRSNLRQSRPKPPETSRRAEVNRWSAAAVAAKPSAPQIRPTQEMPKVQDLE